MTKKIMQLRNKKNHGFTLIELIIVIAILAILAAILVPLVSGHLNDARESAGNANARTIYAGATAYVTKLLSTNQSIANLGENNSAALLKEYVGDTLAATGTFSVNAVTGAVISATWKDNNGKEYKYTPNTSPIATSPIAT